MKPHHRGRGLLDDFDTLTNDEQMAWIGWFAGGKSLVIQWGDNPSVNFGKCECEQVDFASTWLGKFASLGWVEVREARRFRALGMVGQPEAVEFEILPTDLGRSVRDGHWERVSQSK